MSYIQVDTTVQRCRLSSRLGAADSFSSPLYISSQGAYLCNFDIFPVSSVTSPDRHRQKVSSTRQHHPAARHGRVQWELCLPGGRHQCHGSTRQPLWCFVLLCQWPHHLERPPLPVSCSNCLRSRCVVYDLISRVYFLQSNMCSEIHLSQRLDRRSVPENPFHGPLPRIRIPQFHQIQGQVEQRFLELCVRFPQVS